MALHYGPDTRHSKKIGNIIASVYKVWMQLEIMFQDEKERSKTREVTVGM